jgi:hypothetical protein
VHAGAQAVVGTVEAPLGRGGVTNQNQGQPHAKSLTHASQPPLWSQDAERKPVLRASDAERSL